MTIPAGWQQRMQQARTMSREPRPDSKLDSIFGRFGFSFPRCGISIGEGWVPIFEEFLQEIILNGYEVKFEQVKQKFGDLRIYFQSPQYDKVQELLNKAEIKCAVTCEQCGNEARKENRDGWLAVLCEPCAKVHEEEREARLKGR